MKMDRRDGLKWAVLAITALFLFFLGKSNYHQRFPAEFVLIVLGAMAVLIFAFYFLSNKEKS